MKGICLIWSRGRHFSPSLPERGPIQGRVPTGIRHLAHRMWARVQGWRSGESTRLPPMWPGFDSQIRRQMWVEFVGSLLCTERFSPGAPASPLL